MKNTWQNIIKSFSSFNIGEKRAMLVLVASMCAMLLFLLTKNLKKNQPLSPEEKSTIDSLLTLIDTSSYQSKKLKKERNKIKKEYKLQAFDPNTASKNELLNLGIPPKTAQTIINFRNKNGVFRKPEDLKKIYGLSPSLYEKLEPYISIAGKKKKKRLNQTKKPETPKDTSLSKGNNIATNIVEEKPKVEEREESIVNLVNINTADSSTLIQVRGIGPYFSSAIIKRRNLLGGYYDIHQLKEVYGLNDTIFLNIRDQLIVSGSVEKIDLNMADIKTLAKHPYISWKQAKLIIKYRDQHGPYQKVGELINIRAFNQEFYRKIAPYLTT